MAKEPRYSVDTSVGKSVVMNGMKMPGVTRVGLEMGADDVVTELTLTMCIREDSLVWDKDGIRFWTIRDLTEAPSREPQAPRVRRPRAEA